MIALFFASLLLGQLGGMTVAPGVVVYVHDIVLVGTLVVCGFRTKKFLLPRLLKPLLLFVAAAVISLIVNAAKFSPRELTFSGLYLVRWALYAGVYMLAVQNYLKKERWLYGLFGVGSGLGVLGLVQFFLYPDLRNLMYLGWDPHFYRLFSTLLDPNFAGILFVLTIILGVYLWENKKIRRLVAAGVLISTVSLLLTYSRSSSLAVIGAGTMYGIYKKQWKIIVGIALFVLVVLVFPKTSGNTLSLLRSDSTLARVGNWQESIALIGRSPVFGWGFDTLRYTRDTEGEFISKSDAGMDSSILFVTATTGIVGLAVYGYLIFSMLQVGTAMGVTYYASMIALAIHSLFVNSAFYPWVLIWFWVLTGAAERISGDK